MVEKRFVDHSDIKGLINENIRQMYFDNFKPDIILSPVKGGLYPTSLLASYFDCDVYNLDIKNLKNYINEIYLIETTCQDRSVLVFDDICDTGSTLHKISNILTNKNFERIKYGCLHYNIGEDSFSPDYYGEEINKNIINEWLVYEWEVWWREF